MTQVQMMMAGRENQYFQMNRKLREIGESQYSLRVERGRDKSLIAKHDADLLINRGKYVCSRDDVHTEGKKKY